MELTKEYLLQKREEYKSVYMDALATANANNGAMQAIDDLLAQMSAPEPEPKQEPLEDAL